YARDMERVIDAVGKTPGARAQLVGVLAGRGLFDEAIKVWTSLSAEERREQALAGAGLARTLYERQQYHRALQSLVETGEQGLALEKISNAGFESDIGQPRTQLFQWQVTPAPAQVAVDARTAHGGSRSLRILFNASGQVDFRNVWQVVTVQPSTRYRLSFFVRTGELSSAATLVTTVADAAAETAALGTSAPVPTGTNDWQQVSFEFATGAKTEAVVVRLVRAGCPAESCPIFGKIWYDDFDLQRSGGRDIAR
ncbi:MAG TPA: carbohydrate binding domain-containing protein, partial [Pyrinomonadaceae bacterium]|nr:carbohydrate binding domain-containing protein [Pyrinomonadaceae bacterium]